ncbi:hypothetical protein, partial [Escherichia coli]|uniref:hypothetical protein n=2 Tax=Enterobacteriaceae TaxID=543 RepID=UPI003BDBBB6B
ISPVKPHQLSLCRNATIGQQSFGSSGFMTAVAKALLKQTHAFAIPCTELIGYPPDQLKNGSSQFS